MQQLPSQHHQHQLPYSPHKPPIQSPSHNSYGQTYTSNPSASNNASAYNSYPQHPPTSNIISSSGSQRLDSLLKSPQGPPSYATNDLTRQLYGGGGATQVNGVSTSHIVPQPPERKGSYEAMAHIGTLQWDSTLPSSPSSKENAPPKRVSFHDTKLDESSKADYDSSASKSPYGRNTTDDDNVLLTPSNSQQLSTYTVGNSPGVIGAQEVYRDPRHRIEANRQPGFLTPRGPGPEQLSFREKMKKFALETGEDTTPRDKVKISKAQREIEINLKPPS